MNWKRKKTVKLLTLADIDRHNELTDDPAPKFTSWFIADAVRQLKDAGVAKVHDAYIVMMSNEDYKTLTMIEHWGWWRWTFWKLRHELTIAGTCIRQWLRGERPVPWETD